MSPPPGAAERWPLLRFKFIFRRLQRPIPAEAEVVTAFRDGQVTLRKNRREEGFTFADKEIGYQGVKPGDLVVHAMDGFAGAIGVCSSEGKCSPVCSVCVPRNTGTDTRFYAYYLRHLAKSGFIQSLARGIRERSTEFRFRELQDVAVPVPDLRTQSGVANFLDRKTATIDALIEKHERAVALLGEELVVVATTAVTRGLNPGEPLRDSGVEWIGKVPATWKVLPVRRVFDVLDGKRVPIEVEERAQRRGDVPYYGASGIIDHIDDFLFDEPLVLVCEDGWNLLLRTQPVARSLHGRAWVNNHAHVLRPRWGNVEYWAAALELTPFDIFVTGMRQPKLTLDELLRVPVPVPSESEADHISARLLELRAVAERVSGAHRRACVVLREYRQALITAAVTGQIDVKDREAA